MAPIQMSMRSGSSRNGAPALVAAREFAWDRASLATLRHSTLPWDEPLTARALETAKDLGSRDRLSLLAQFAAHQGLLRFAGIADGELDPADWRFVSKRGEDVRLVRLKAGRCDPATAPPFLSVAQQFADLVGASAEVLAQPYARADALYIEAFLRLTGDIAADLRWLRNAACGCVATPGPDLLRTLSASSGLVLRGGAEAAATIRRYASLDGAAVVVTLCGASPLARLSAFASLIADPALDVAVAAERVVSMTAARPHLFLVDRWESFDDTSKRLVELLTGARHGAWVLPGEGEPLPSSRWFVVAPRMRAAADAVAALTRVAINEAEAFAEFVGSTDLERFLITGEAFFTAAAIPAVGEPKRSYLGALALLGLRIPADVARRYLQEFLFAGELDSLAVAGLTRVEGEVFAFENESVRDEARRWVPQSSRAAISAVAASVAGGVDAALLWLDAGEPDRASAALSALPFERSADTVAALGRVPRSLMGRELLATYANALVDCGRFRDARDCASQLAGEEQELLLARIERRTGDYAAALARLERIESGLFAVGLLRAEVLRLCERMAEAERALEGCEPSSTEQRMRFAFECATLAFDRQQPYDRSWMQPHYYTERFKTYLAIAEGDAHGAAAHAEEAHRLARTLLERVDASLDRLYAVFSEGCWDEARSLAVAALEEVEETQGDRAAGGILFTLAWLAADNGQWAYAAQRIARLRHFYSRNGDDIRLTELQLLAAHLDFSRGRFRDARRAAAAVHDGRLQNDQIREAAAWILDELDLLERREGPLRSTGRSGNAELTRRHESVVRRRAGEVLKAEQCASGAVPRRLAAFRLALAAGDRERAERIATELDLHLEPQAASPEMELRLLRAAATREFPFQPNDFDAAWCFATRNRLGQWHVLGSHPADAETLDAAIADGPGEDWIECSDRELLFIEGSSSWSTDGRDAAAAMFRTRAEAHRLRRVVEQEEGSRVREADPIDGMIGQSSAIREAESRIALVARRNVPVCILGESGTGKELAARAIHRHSPRRQKPFTAVNCAALPENLIESELFGHLRGAFTGADRDRPGLIETTDGGTLFLDEVGELPMAAQAKLLRFLQEGEFRRVGDTQNRSADVRIVSATNRKLDSAVDEGRFREDLYYRIRGVEIELPPLRERGGDILLLASRFLALERERHRAGPLSLSGEVEAVFTSYRWPGNVRELQNTIRGAHAMAGDAREIELEHLPERLRRVTPVRASLGSYQDAVIRFRRDLIERSLEAAKGNQNRAASMLKMSRQALAYQIRELGIVVER